MHPERTYNLAFDYHPDHICANPECRCREDYYGGIVHEAPEHSDTNREVVEERLRRAQRKATARLATGIVGFILLALCLFMFFRS